MKYLVLILVLGGCTLNVEDKRLTRDEVAVAFQQRDRALEVLAKEIQALKLGKANKAPKK